MFIIYCEAYRKKDYRLMFVPKTDYTEVTENRNTDPLLKDIRTDLKSIILPSTSFGMTNRIGQYGPGYNFTMGRKNS